MPTVSSETLQKLQFQIPAIRNICILAHVDHGKTSLTDSLLASNGIISSKLAGKVRYLDSREDEQQRGITMEASAISLYFRILTHSSKEITNQNNIDKNDDNIKEYLINLIDSPGHIDFSTEVSTASRLCDGALILVDVVEGVCSQTVNVLRQTWIDEIKPILVFNKLDRLITELKMSPVEAYFHLTKLLEDVNAVMGSFYTGDRMQEDLLWRESNEKNNEKSLFIEKDDQDIYFNPQKGDVIFASAIDGWAFSISQFASIYERKLGMKRANLEKVLWGDFYYDNATKKVKSGRKNDGKATIPLFAKLCLENIWSVYNSVILNRDTDKINSITKALGIKLLPRDLRSKDEKSLLISIMSQWLPISSAILLSVTNIIPNPLEAQKLRMPKILSNIPENQKIDPKLKDSIVNCDKNGPVVAYVSKMVAIPKEDLDIAKRSKENLSEEEMQHLRTIAREKAESLRRQNEINEELNSTQSYTLGQTSLSDDLAKLNLEENGTDDYENLHKENEDVLIAFSRIYSGTLTVGDEVYVLGPKYSPSSPNKHINKTTVKGLYILMGRELYKLNSVPAGNIVGIEGLDGKIIKNGTVCSQSNCINLTGSNVASAPIVRVAVEPLDISKMNQLEKGLKLLNQADPCVQIIEEETGEHIMLCAGELHLERCLKDLRERFAKVEIQSSKPIVPFRETIIIADEMKPLKDDLPRGSIKFVLGNATISLRTVPLPPSVTNFLLEQPQSIRHLLNHFKIEKDLITKDTIKDEDDDLENFNSELNDFNKRVLPPLIFKEKLSEAFNISDGDKYYNVAKLFTPDDICAFGSKRVGANILVNKSNLKIPNVFFNSVQLKSNDPTQNGIIDGLLNGFQHAMAQGPLCAEPVQGVACIIESVEYNFGSTSENSSKDNDNERKEVIKEENLNTLQISAQANKGIRNSIMQGFLQWSPRICLAVYSCQIQATTEVLGKVYQVITKRRGRITQEVMEEGSSFFTITAALPVAESFGFSDDIRKKTSGSASPLLIFAGFEILDEDPFWVPTTEEELEDLGELADKENVAKRYMDTIRKRKGLFVENKVVERADKQRTLKK